MFVGLQVCKSESLRACIQITLGSLLVGSRLIGASLSEPYTSESNGGFFIYYYIYIYLFAVRMSFRKGRLSSFNPKHCTR